MNKDRVRIGRTKTSCKVKCTADCTSVVGAMVDEMGKHLFAGHCTSLPVKKTKTDHFQKLFGWR